MLPLYLRFYERAIWQITISFAENLTELIENERNNRQSIKK